MANPDPKPGDIDGLAGDQQGLVGDITASRKVKVPECSEEEMKRLYRERKPFPWHWGNSLYLEWFSVRNGRVVIESAAFELDLDPDRTWEMTEAEEAEQREANAVALTSSMDRLLAAASAAAGNDDAAPGPVDPGGDSEDADEDAPQSAAEAVADAEATRMDLLLDRVTARIEREGGDEVEDFERILEEERERLRRERGEPKVELTPGQEEERAAWIEEMNAAAEEALTEEAEAERWRGGEGRDRDRGRDRRHPLVQRCSDLSVQVYRDVEAGGWVDEHAQREHPMLEISGATAAAAAKLAGALGMAGDGEWPPDPITAGDTLVRLKKARGFLRDALRGLDSADEEDLASPAWRLRVRREVGEILDEAQGLIRQVREMLADEDDPAP